MSLTRRQLGTIPQSPEEQRAQSARTLLDILYEMATLLNTGLDRQSLAHALQLLEEGTNPDALAAVIRDLRAEAKKQAER